MTEVFEECYKQLKILVGDTEVNERTLYIPLRFAMEIVEFSEAEKGERKNLVRALLKKLVGEAAGGRSCRWGEECLKLIDSEYFDHSIDLIVDASKGDLCLNKLRQKAEKGRVNKLLGCLCQ